MDEAAYVANEGPMFVMLRVGGVKGEGNSLRCLWLRRCGAMTCEVYIALRADMAVPEEGEELWGVGGGEGGGLFVGVAACCLSGIKSVSRGQTGGRGWLYEKLLLFFFC